MAIENGKWVFPTYDRLEDAVLRFFEILDTQEFSDNAQRYFHPIKLETDNSGKTVISSIRVFKTAELESLLPQMKALARTSYVIQKEIDELGDWLFKNSETKKEWWIEKDKQRALCKELQEVQMKEWDL